MNLILKPIKVDTDKLTKIRAKLVVEGASARKISLVDSFAKKVNSYGEVRPEWKENGSSTGRITSSNPCLTNLPIEAREALVAEEGNTFIIADWKAMEVRLMAYMAGCESLSKAVDMYQEIANKLGIERKQAKVAMISLQYGAGDLLLS